MGEGMIFGKKKSDDDSDLYFHKYLAELLGDDDVLETVNGMLEQRAARRAAQKTETRLQSDDPAPDAHQSVGEKKSCWNCKHLDRSMPLRCAGFPDGIPLYIRDGRVVHTQPIPHQGNELAWERYTADSKVLPVKPSTPQPVRVVPQDVQELLDKLQESRNAGSRIDEGWAIANIGRYHRLKDHAADAHKHYVEALIIFHELRDIEGFAWVRREQGMVLRGEGQHDKAEEMLLQALALHQKLNSLHEQAFDLIELGNIARARKQLDKAVSYLTPALALARQAGDSLMIAYALQDLGVVEHWRGHPGRAFDLLEEALRFYRQNGEKHGTAAVMGDLGAVAIDLKEYERAEDYLSRAILAFEAEKESREVGLCYLNFGQLHQARGDLDAARAAVQKGERILSAVGATIPPFGVTLKRELGLF